MRTEKLPSFSASALQAGRESRPANQRGPSRNSSGAPRPAARLRGQRTVCSARARPLPRPARSSHYRAPKIEHSSTAHCIALPRDRRCSLAASRVHQLSVRASPALPSRNVVLVCGASASCPPVLRTGSNSNAHAGYGVGLCSLRGCHVTGSGLTRRSTGHPTAGHNGSLRLGRAAVGCRLPLR